MRRLGTALALALIALATAAAQSSGDYLKLRKSHHIVQPISIENLNQLVGTKVVELKGVVNGTCGTKDTISLILQMSDGNALSMDCSTPPPDWVLNGEVAIRALVTVTRPEPKAALTASLISLAPEMDIEKVDDAYWAAEAAKKPTRVTKHLASRGDIHGRIGRSRRDAAHLTQEEYDEDVAAYTHFIRTRNPRLNAAEANNIARGVIYYSLGYGIDPRFPMAVFMVESDFDPNSTNSKSGAMGLGQLMPGTASWMGVRNPYDSVDNVQGAIRLLRTHFNSYFSQTGDKDRAVRLTLAAYNAGECAVRKYGGIPPYAETQAYVVRVLNLYRGMCSSPSDPIVPDN
jgi:soluble lytic murein transglycosylase-like protein